MDGLSDGSKGKGETQDALSARLGAATQPPGWRGGKKGVLSNRSVMLARVIRKRRLAPVETDRA